MADSVSLVAFGVLLIWVVVLTYLVVRSSRQYERIIRKTDKRGLQTLFDRLISSSENNEKNLTNLQNTVNEQNKQLQNVLQKISLVRFNPFRNTGGEQSFIVGLFDKHNSGIILTSLQGRTGTRWYTKEVRNGKGTEFELSKEEETAVKKAKPL